MTALRRPRSTVLPAAALAVLIAACGDGPTDVGDDASVASVVVTPGDTVLTALGQTVRLTAEALDADGNAVPGAGIAWSCGEDCGTVQVAESSGEATAVANGAATITATAEVTGVSGSATVRVLQAVETVAVDPADAVLELAGETQEFTATATDANGNELADAEVVWLSSDHTVATIDTDGLATAKGAGTSTITAAVQGVPGRAELSVAGHGEAAKLAFTSLPAEVEGQEPFAPAVRVEIQDAAGHTVRSASAEVTVALAANPAGGTLSGTLTVSAEEGVARFDDLAVELPGAGYALEATTGSLTGATSEAFDVVLTFVQQSPGYDHSCGVTAAHHAYCWGLNGIGQLGDGTTTDRSAPVPVAGGHDFASITLDGVHTCGLTTEGAAYCWGWNEYGQLGDGTAEDSPVPVAVTGDHTFAAIDAGVYHNCGITTDDAAYCWGRNVNGQLGNETTAPSAAPVAVAGDHDFASVRAGTRHTCAVTTGGTAYCWGDNSYGQLGDKSTTDRDAPVTVYGNHLFDSVSGGDRHTCGVRADGDALCWGYDGSGRLGNGGAGSDSVPDFVSTSVDFVDVRAGISHTCAVAGGGAAYCWGDNDYGQVGHGEEGGAEARPVAVSGGLRFSSIGAGRHHACGRTSEGVYCWGRNFYGQLGNATTGGSLVPVRVKH